MGALPHGRATARIAVHRDEPLWRRAKDDRVFAAPAVRIAMLVIFTEQEHAAFLHELNNLRIRFEDVETRELLDLSSELAGMIHGAIDFKSVFLPDHKIIVAVPRRRVNATCAGFAGRGFRARVLNVEFSFSVGFAAQRDMLAQNQERWTIKPGMSTFQAIEFRATKAGQDFR